MPFEGRGRMTGNPGGDPFACAVAPDIPFAGADVALRSEDPAPVTIGLVRVEFECLRVLRGLDVEVEIVNQVSGRVHGAELLPPQGIGISVAAGNVKLTRAAAKRRAGC